jgi:hypothetical protein
VPSIFQAYCQGKCPGRCIPSSGRELGRFFCLGSSNFGEHVPVCGRAIDDGYMRNEKR